MKKSVSEIPFLDFFKKAWNVTFHNRFLWWLGFMVALAGGANFNLPSGGDGQKEKESAQKIGEFITQNMEWVIIGAVFLFILYLIFIAISILGRGALIKSLDHINKNEPTGFKASVKEGKQYFWRLFLLGLTLIILTILSLIVIATPIVFLFATKSYILGAVLTVLAIFILIPFFIVIGYLKSYGNIYIVLGNLRVGSAIESAYNLFRNNILSSIIMGLLFFPIGILMFFLVLAVIFLLLLIFAPLGFLFYSISGKIAVGIIIALGVLIFIIIMALIRSIYEVFAQAAWLLFFEEIAKPKEEEKITEMAVETEKAEVLPAGDPIKTIETEK